MYTAKKSDKTEKGSGYTILQDGPTSFHVSVQNGDYVVYEHFLNPPTLEFLEKSVLSLEEELFTLIQSKTS